MQFYVNNEFFMFAFYMLIKRSLLTVTICSVNQLGPCHQQLYELIKSSRASLTNSQKLGIQLLHFQRMGGVFALYNYKQQYQAYRRIYIPHIFSCTVCEKLLQILHHNTDRIFKSKIDEFYYDVTSIERCEMQRHKRKSN